LRNGLPRHLSALARNDRGFLTDWTTTRLRRWMCFWRYFNFLWSFVFQVVGKSVIYPLLYAFCQKKNTKAFICDILWMVNLEERKSIMIKRLGILFGAIMIMMGVCGCMNINSNYGRNENNQEYAELMRIYMEETYSAEFQIVEYIFPEAGINSGMKENVVVLKDRDGVLANVKARMGTPYAYYDDYVDACGAHRIESRLDLSGLRQTGNAQLYAVVKTDAVADIDITPAGVTSVTLVVNIPHPQSQEAMQSLYDAYKQICNAGYGKLYLIAWFTDGSAEFDQAVENYRVYGKSSWKNYNGKVYAALKITDTGLSYEDFCAALIEN